MPRRFASATSSRRSTLPPPDLGFISSRALREEDDDGSREAVLTDHPPNRVAWRLSASRRVG